MPEQDGQDGRTEGLEVALADGVLTVTLARPEVFNALTGAMMERLAAELERASARDDVRVVVLTGTGRAFSSGADLSGSDAHERFDRSSMEVTTRVVRAITRCDRPVVAAVNGVAAGVGCSIALAADVVLAAEEASFLLVFSRVGLMTDGGASETLAASVGRARAMRMALLADPLTAAEGLAAGLVTEVVPAADLAARTQAYAARFAAGPPLAHAATKRAVNAATLPHLEDTLEREARGQLTLFRTADAAEGMRAFAEKRPPRFTGR